MPRLIYLLPFLFCCVLRLSAQEHISGTIGTDTPYTDLIQCDIDDQGLDLNVRATFDEASNLVTVSLTSPRQLFAFYEMHRHRDVFKGWLGRRKLRINQLFGSRLIEPRSSYRMKGSVIHRYRKPRKNHVYLPWLRTDYKDTLTPAVRLLPDSLVETFTIPGGAREIEFTLRDILVVEHASGLPANIPLAKPSKRKHYRFIADRDLRRTYHLVILRDPCLYSGEEQTAARQRLDLLRDEWRELRQAYSPTTSITPEAHDLLVKSKSYIALRHHSISDTTACKDLQALYTAYNNLLDTISRHDCPILQPAIEASPEDVLPGINPESILAQAHRIDSNVARYLISRIPQEKSDLSRECRKIIADIQDLINTNGVIGDEQRKAVATFNQSVSYFRKICKH